MTSIVSNTGVCNNYDCSELNKYVYDMKEKIIKHPRKQKKINIYTFIQHGDKNELKKKLIFLSWISSSTAGCCICAQFM